MPCRLAVIGGARVRISQRVNSENRLTGECDYAPNRAPFDIARPLPHPAYRRDRGYRRFETGCADRGPGRYRGSGGAYPRPHREH